MAEKKNNGVVFSFDPNAAKPKAKPKGQLDARTLKEAGEFTIVFLDTKAIKVVELLEIDSYNLLVVSGGKILLVPKHSIEYILFDREVRNVNSNSAAK